MLPLLFLVGRRTKQDGMLLQPKTDSIALADINVYRQRGLQSNG
jgi:hypothetical protein